MPVIPDVSPKTCRACLESKQPHDFVKDSRSKDGLGTWCRSCKGKKNAEWARSNKEAIAAIGKKWRTNNPDKVAELKAKWRSNPENKKAELQKKREWAKANMEKGRLYSAKRRARKLSSDIALVTANDLSKIKAMSCIYCGSPFEELEHIIPLARGGRHALGNLASSCTECNQSKGSKFVMEWKKTKVRYN